MPPAIELQNFSYSYPDGTGALRNISLTVRHGEKLALIGPNGAGKSTLLLAVAGFVKGTGNLRVDGLEVNKKNSRKIRTSLGCCLENPEEQLFMPTLFDDVAFGPLNLGLDAEQVSKRVTDALQTVGLADMADKAPHHLSAGQKRAAAVATILSMNPKIVVLDEPDGSLDPRNRSKLVRILRSLSQTLVVATCNINFAAAVADRAVVIDAGRLVADGDAETIMSDANLMAEHGLEVAARFQHRPVQPQEER